MQEEYAVTQLSKEKQLRIKKIKVGSHHSYICLLTSREHKKWSITIITQQINHLKLFLHSCMYYQVHFQDIVCSPCNLIKMQIHLSFDNISSLSTKSQLSLLNLRLFQYFKLFAKLSFQISCTVAFGKEDQKNKNVDILHLANYICRRLTGKRFNFNSNIFFFISILSSMIRIFALNFLISLSSSGVNPFWPFTYL